MSKALILIIGLPGSGKSFAASVIKKHFHAKVFENGDIVRDEIRKRGLPYTPENDTKIRLWFHRGREHLIVERLWKRMRVEKGVVVVVGFRSPKELTMIKRLYDGRIFLIRIKSSFRARSQREIKRGRFGKAESISYLRSRDKSELSDLVGLRQLLKKADYTIDNSRLSKRQMERKVFELVRELLA